MNDSDRFANTAPIPYPAHSSPLVVEQLTILGVDVDVVQYAMFATTPAKLGGEAPTFTHGSGYYAIERGAPVHDLALMFRLHDGPIYSTSKDTPTHWAGDCVVRCGRASTIEGKQEIGTGKSAKLAIASATAALKLREVYRVYGPVAVANIGTFDTDTWQALDAAAEIHPGDLVAIHSHGRMRLGVAYHVTRTGTVKALIATPSGGYAQGATGKHGPSARLYRAATCTVEDFTSPHAFEHDAGRRNEPSWPEGYELCGKGRDADVHRADEYDVDQDDAADAARRADAVALAAGTVLKLPVPEVDTRQVLTADEIAAAAKPTTVVDVDGQPVAVGDVVECVGPVNAVLTGKRGLVVRVSRDDVTGGEGVELKWRERGVSRTTRAAGRVRLVDDGMVLDGNGDPVPADAEGLDEPDALRAFRLFMAGRVPARDCPHYVATMEDDGGYRTCEQASCRPAAADTVVDLLTAEGHDQDDVVAAIDSLIESGLTTVRPGNAPILTEEEIDVVRDRLAGLAETMRARTDLSDPARGDWPLPDGKPVIPVLMDEPDELMTPDGLVGAIPPGFRAQPEQQHQGVDVHHGPADDELVPINAHPADPAAAGGVLIGCRRCPGLVRLWMETPTSEDAAAGLWVHITDDRALADVDGAVWADIIVGPDATGTALVAGSQLDIEGVRYDVPDTLPGKIRQFAPARLAYAIRQAGYEPALEGGYYPSIHPAGRRIAVRRRVVDPGELVGDANDVTAALADDPGLRSLVPVEQRGPVPAQRPAAEQVPDVADPDVADLAPPVDEQGGPPEVVDHRPGRALDGFGRPLQETPGAVRFTKLGRWWLVGHGPLDVVEARTAADNALPDLVGEALTAAALVLRNRDPEHGLSGIVDRWVLHIDDAGEWFAPVFLEYCAACEMGQAVNGRNCSTHGG